MESLKNLSAFAFMNRSTLVALVAATLSLFAGCKTQTLYHWGNYESMLYAQYSSPGKLTALDQLQLMQEDQAKAEAANRALPPGFFAQLGRIHVELGQVDEARAAFEREKAVFPESAPLMDRFISTLPTS